MKDTDNDVNKEGITKVVLPELQSVINKIATNEGYVTYEITTTKITSGGANYTGELFEIDVKGKTKNGEKETNLFLKKGVHDDVLGDLVSVSSVYVTENDVYQDLANCFQELQNQANVPEEERYKMVKCYENSKTTTIILENMAKKGFTTPHRMNVVSPKYAELCMEQLAKFHALGFALQLKHPDYFEKKVRHYKYPIKDIDKMSSGWENLLKMTIKNLDPVNVAKAQRVKAAFYEKYMKYMSAEYSSVTCLCHGDFRASNILMRENDGEVVEVIPVDYQCIYFGCPVNDILFFIAYCTDRKFRVQHFENMKTLYHDTLTNFLKYFNIDSNEVFPRKEMDEIFRQRMDYVPILAVMGFPFLFVPENGLDVNDSIMEANFDLDERYKERLIEILEDFPLQ